jgi:hypothetical protein
VLFNLYANSLSQLLNQCGKGVIIDGLTVNNLSYADDLVLIAETEEDLQPSTCYRTGVSTTTCVSISTSRNPSVIQTSYQFQCSDQQVELADSHCYLGLVLSQHLDYAIMAKAVAKSAGRALGLLIGKSKVMGGLPYETFTTVYDSTVWATIS